MKQPSPAPALIGVFDSGVGGLSVLRALHSRLPGTPLLYVADSGHAPYGDRDTGHVIDRSIHIANHLLQAGAGLLVVACNTATALAVEAIRARWPEVDVVGVEPGIKPAVAASRNGRIGVLATPATLASVRFASLVERYAAGRQILPVPCPGLAAAIERGDEADAEIDALLDRFCAPLVAAGVDTVVLGCTHYPFIAARIAQRLGSGVTLMDTATAIARRAADLRPAAAGADAPAGTAPVRLQSTGDATVLQRLARQHLGLQVPVENLAV
ncbi:MAG TPA: glutamate racemase [Ideonella sp.]|nr:glutamate racemase [Ideonella sp.]